MTAMVALVGPGLEFVSDVREGSLLNCKRLANLARMFHSGNSGVSSRRVAQPRAPDSVWDPRSASGLVGVPLGVKFSHQPLRFGDLFRRERAV